MVSINIVDNLKQKIQNREINTVFQPIYSNTLQIVGYEALSRIAIEGMNIEQIFQLATEKELADQLDIACIEASLKNYFLEGVEGNQKLFLNINISTLMNIKENGIYEKLVNKNVVLEITEKQHVENYEPLIQTVNQLKEKGIQIAIDDILSGYQRLFLTSILTPNYMKIERRAVENCHADNRKRIILKSLLDMAEGLGMNVVFEGIETLDEFYALLELSNGSDKVFYQGFLFNHADTLKMNFIKQPMWMAA